jgi:hypothetical protein
MKLCEHCGKPYYGTGKYHIECRYAVRAERARNKYAEDPSKNKEAVKKYRENGKSCSCCHINPIDKENGNVFLCSQCFAWDGDGWKEYYSFSQAQKNKILRAKLRLAADIKFIQRLDKQEGIRA